MDQCNCKDQVYHDCGCHHWKPVFVCPPAWESAARREFGDTVHYVIQARLPDSASEQQNK